MARNNEASELCQLGTLEGELSGCRQSFEPSDSLQVCLRCR